MTVIGSGISNAGGYGCAFGDGGRWKEDEAMAIREDAEAVEEAIPLTLQIPMETFHKVKDFAEHEGLTFQNAFVVLVHDGLKMGGLMYTEPVSMELDKKVSITVNLPIEVFDGMQEVCDMSEISKAAAAVVLIDEGLKGGRVLERVRVP